MNLVKFAHPEYLYLLILLPVLLGIFYFSGRMRKRAMERFGNIELLQLLMPSRSKRKRSIKFFLLFVAFGFLIFGIANPQIGSKLEEVKREGVDVFICLDVSESMKAEDIKPTRLDNAKREISEMLDNFQNDRIGLIVFAGDSYLQLPLTTDYDAARLLLSTIDVDAVPVPGTAIGSAIRLAMKSFVQTEKKHQAIIVVTDGENHEDDAIAAAKDANAEGIIVHTVGMGSPLGAPIPIYQNNVQVGFKKDNEGNTVVTKLDQAALQQIAEAGGGKFVLGTSQQNELKSIFNDISTMEKKEFGSKVVTEYEDRFQYFLFPVLLLIVIEFFISERKNLLLAKWKSLATKPFSFRMESEREGVTL
ncbi:MAG: VWA domain-containing protein [Bacteroidota bacterium]